METARARPHAAIPTETSSGSAVPCSEGSQPPRWPKVRVFAEPIIMLGGVLVVWGISGTEVLGGAALVMNAAEWFRYAVAFLLGALSVATIAVARGHIERRQGRAAWRHDFQRDTLLALQEAVAHRSALALQILSRPQCANACAPEQVISHAMTTLELDKLAPRIKDAQTRQRIQELRAATARVSGLEPDADYAAIAREILSATAAVNQRIGSQLRKL
jgi:fermentation-respiration switch protein FrsA (DUF1100 family)